VTLLLLLFDVPLPSEEVSRNPWVPLILVSMVAVVLAVGFLAALVFFLIWFKRRKLKQTAEVGEGS